MLRFSLAGFPVTVQPWFFLMAWLIGRSIPDLPGQLLWIAVVFLGVLLHELGHALAARRLGFRPEITLHAMGGLTSWRPTRRVTPWQEIGITFAGPAVGIAIGLAALVAGSGALPAEGGGLPAPLSMTGRVLEFAVWVNLGWGVLNLLPVLPLDGGSIVATGAAALFGRSGRIGARVFSVVLTVALAAWGAVSLDLFLGLLGLWLTWINWQALRRELSPPAPPPPPAPPEA
jgi:stage IV sporulation protein FB